MATRATTLILLFTFSAVAPASAAPRYFMVAERSQSPSLSAHGVQPTGSGVLIADYRGHRVLLLGNDGRLTTFAGTGEPGFAGDGRAARAARLRHPFGIRQLADGTIVIADYGNRRLRGVRPDGTIHTLAGSGREGYSGDGGPAASADLHVHAGSGSDHSHGLSAGLAPDAAGGFYFSDAGNWAIIAAAPGGHYLATMGGVAFLQTGETPVLALRATQLRCAGRIVARAARTGASMATFRMRSRVRLRSSCRLKVEARVAGRVRTRTYALGSRALTRYGA